MAELCARLMMSENAISRHLTHIRRVTERPDAAGIDFRVPMREQSGAMMTRKDGSPVYAVRNRAVTYCLPSFAHPAFDPGRMVRIFDNLSGPMLVGSVNQSPDCSSDPTRLVDGSDDPNLFISKDDDDDQRARARTNPDADRIRSASDDDHLTDVIESWHKRHGKTLDRDQAAHVYAAAVALSSSKLSNPTRWVLRVIAKDQGDPNRFLPTHTPPRYRSTRGHVPYQDPADQTVYDQGFDGMRRADQAPPEAPNNTPPQSEVTPPAEPFDPTHIGPGRATARETMAVIKKRRAARAAAAATDQTSTPEPAPELAEATT
jgi:hypothetical protein